MSWKRKGVFRITAVHDGGILPRWTLEIEEKVKLCGCFIMFGVRAIRLLR